MTAAQVQEQGTQIQLLHEKLEQKEASMAAAVDVRVAAAVPTTPPQAPPPFEKVTQIKDHYSMPVGSGIAIFGIEGAKLKEVVEGLVQSKLGLSKEEWKNMVMGVRIVPSRNNSKFPPRVVLSCVDEDAKIRILRRAYNLHGTNIHMAHELSPEEVARRRAQIPLFKLAREAGLRPKWDFHDPTRMLCFSRTPTRTPRVWSEDRTKAASSDPAERPQDTRQQEKLDKKLDMAGPLPITPPQPHTLDGQANSDMSIDEYRNPFLGQALTKIKWTPGCFALDLVSELGEGEMSMSKECEECHVLEPLFDRVAGDTSSFPTPTANRFAALSLADHEL